MKLPPQVALERRAQWLAWEDSGKLRPGEAGRILNEALAARPVATRRLWFERYGGSRDAGFLDLHPGWRLRVITPLLQSGGYQVKGQPTLVPGRNTIEIRTGSDFLGVETAYYRIAPGAHVRLESVQAAVDGKQELRTRPAAELLDVPAFVRHLRVLYLTRRSAADRDMAILGARTFAHLDAATAKVEADPSAACVTTQDVYCSWVPAGIAVLAQVRIEVDGVDQWVAANSTVGEAARTASVDVLRPWRGKQIPVDGPADLVRRLPLLGGEAINSRR